MLDEIAETFVATNVGRAMVFGGSAQVVKFAIPYRLCGGFGFVALRRADRASAWH